MSGNQAFSVWSVFLVRESARFAPQTRRPTSPALTGEAFAQLARTATWFFSPRACENGGYARSSYREETILGHQTALAAEKNCFLGARLLDDRLHIRAQPECRATAHPIRNAPRGPLRTAWIRPGARNRQPQLRAQKNFVKTLWCTGWACRLDRLLKRGELCLDPGERRYRTWSAGDGRKGRPKKPMTTEG